ncbi:hypothetical protein [Nocardioides sp. Leaf285]|uniref:hypothetical protein n=1 Tax=Nocardioides sp. Leaf285 TaxID=1736322 RepID=UPI00070265AC|nr:hypothetical protein [Nocardioides sp. Leaf285]KQP63043.1 hypothetical protein ASF47_18705 [Nocardioides sp. Leaf285]
MQRAQGPLRAALLTAALTAALTACSVSTPAADGEVIELRTTGATTARVCDTVSAVPFVEDCRRVRKPGKCYVWVETPDNGIVRAEVYCDAYRGYEVGDRFTDGTDVIDAVCAKVDEHGRWRYVGGDCSQDGDR